MPSKPGAVLAAARGVHVCAKGSLYGLALLAAGVTAAPAAPAAAERPAAALLLDRLCADTLRPNEEDRLFGMISLTVRATLKYQGGLFSPDLIDDSTQDAVGAIVQACPKIATTDDPQRLGMVVEMIRDATIKRMQDRDAEYSDKQTETATAADLSEELSAPEIDAWLEALPARRRALALFLYASDVTNQEVASAIGFPPAALADQFRSVKTDLLKFFREESSSTPPPPIPGPAMEYRIAGQTLAGLLRPPEPAKPGALLKPDEQAKAGKPTPENAIPKSDEPQKKPDAAPSPSVRITGIASDIYAGWSLLATVTGLPPDRSIELNEPILVEPNGPGRRRMIVVGLDEISDPHDETRHFLLKAFAIDGDKEGAGLHDAFHLGAAAVANPQAQQTLHNTGLAAIEVARCLWHDYGTAPDPGLCR